MKTLIPMLGALGLMAATAMPAMGAERVIVTQEQAPRAELGLEAGFPSGLTGKYWINDKDAVQGGVSFLFPTDAFVMHADYLVHTPSLTDPSDEFKLPLYIGVGGRLISFHHGDTAIGPRVPIGVEAIMKDVPISVFGEVAPALEVGSGPAVVTADASVGARVIF